ncbi:2OG-Fe(II) oxygenase [Streptomyces sp. MZ04]|uniref:2OG-Fe(II) oxygenase n=1 Tax=Streptomyces sp. MZ04 TaxID=2559236 RepID=UPI00143293E7|nr:2OG-Fe(II) oxygenase [Streptomyces sp. MZ04]
MQETTTPAQGSGVIPIPSAVLSGRSAAEQQIAVIPAPLMRVEGFLGEAGADALWRFAVEREGDFVSGQAAGLKRPAAYLSTDSPVLRQRLANCLPLARSVLGIRVPGARATTEITAYGDGQGFPSHTDAGIAGAEGGEQLTGLYYFHRRPQPFTGGQLRLYDTAAQGDRAWRADTYRTIEPAFDTLLLFPVTVHHEVTATHCPSTAFADRRFALTIHVS